MRSIPSVLRFSLQGLFLLALAAVAFAPRAAAAQAVEGSLVSDVDGAPLRGVAVALVDMQGAQVATAVSGPGGAFRLEAPTPGTYMLLVDQEGYATQLSDPVQLEEGRTVRLDLTVRSQQVSFEATPEDTRTGAELLQAAIADACAGVFEPALHAIVFGTIVDERSGQTVPGGQAELRWRIAGAGAAVSAQTRTVGTDQIGAFLVCDFPAAESVEMRARMTDLTGDWTEARFRAGTMSRLDLSIQLSDPTQPGNLFGRVLDYRSGLPLQGATVRLREADRTAVSNQRGIFVLRDVPSGPDVLEVDLIGYADWQQAVQVIGGRAQDIEVRVSVEAVEIAPILVQVKPRRWFSDMAGLNDRMASGNGVIFTREWIEQRGPRLLGDIMREVPGARVMRSGFALSGEYSVQLRGAANMLNQVCPPMVWVDGIRWGTDGTAFRELAGSEIEAVEVYRGAAETPGEFSGGDARCGVVVVWTRRGRDFGGE